MLKVGSQLPLHYKKYCLFLLAYFFIPVLLYIKERILSRKFVRLKKYINNHSCLKLDYQLLIILKIMKLKNKIKNNNIFKNNSTPTI